MLKRMYGAGSSPATAPDFIFSCTAAGVGVFAISPSSGFTSFDVALWKTGGCTAYVADGNQDKSDNGYEWYYWTNIPARVLRADQQTLYFGTADGKVCKFNDDMVTAENEILMRAYNDDGAPIHAEWASKLDSMGNIAMLKTMPKRGSAVHLKRYARSKVDLYIRTERDSGRLYREFYADRLSFEDINFERFTFETSANSVRQFRVKKKKWKMIQFIFVSDALNEGFGIYEILVKYIEAGEERGA